MDIKTITKYNHACIVLIGKLCTLNDYQQLRTVVNNIKIKDNCLIIDLNRLTFTSSHGLGELVAISNSLKKRSIEILFINPREEIRSVITLAGIDRVITLVVSEEELINKIGVENTLPSKVS